MTKRAINILVVFGFMLLLHSCATTNMAKFYEENKITLDSIKQSYSHQYPSAPFSIAFSNKNFDDFSIEIVTDTLKYIYDFNIREERLYDTLIKYKISPQGVASLLTSMQTVGCIWLNNLEYYVNGRKQSLVYMSMRPRAFSFPFAYKKYHILAYFNRPQVFDEKGRVLDGRRRRKIRKINNNTFRKITDTVCYTVSSLFR